MSWTPLMPVTRAPLAKLKPAIAASVSNGAGRIGARVTLQFRPEMLTGIDWLVAGKGVQVMVGFGDHLGMLRIMPNGLHILGTVALAKPAGSVVQTKLPLPTWLPPASRPVAAVEYEWKDQWIEVTIPAIWRDAESAPTPASKLPPAATIERGRQLAAEAAEIARRKAGR